MCVFEVCELAEGKIDLRDAPHPEGIQGEEGHLEMGGRGSSNTQVWKERTPSPGSTPSS